MFTSFLIQYLLGDIYSSTMFRYHEFGIKLPIGCNVTVERETGAAKDEFALLCKVPCHLDNHLLEMVMVSKSKKTQYNVRDVVGKTIGRVQYFPNKTFVELMEEGRVKCIEGLVSMSNIYLHLT